MARVRFPDLPRLVRTARHLRASQVLWRLKSILTGRRNARRGTAQGRWAWSAATLPRVRADFPELPRTERSSASSERLTDLLGRGVFEHLGRAVEVGYDAPDWRLGEVREERLWTITLHYHGWAWSLAQSAAESLHAAQLFCHFVNDWIERCPLDRPGSTALAWNSYSIATRLGYWARSWALAGPDLFSSMPELEARFLRSAWQQAAYLSDHLEWDLRGNHLMRDAVGMAVAGRFFAHPRAESWLKRATELAVDQAAEQVLTDGGHFERSPKYHVDVMEDLLTLALLTEDPGAQERLRNRWAAMARFLAWVCHPDGEMARLNDGTPGSACPASRMLALGDRIGVAPSPRPRGGHNFQETGLVVWHGETWSVLFDVGPLGPDYQPGHGHADTLTFEASYRGSKLVVDAGTYGYDADSQRMYDRSTEAHNTVCIDGENSSEVWHIFRVGRRARPRSVEVRIDGRGLVARASHDGYDFLPGAPRHHRSLSLEEPRGIAVVDRVEGEGEHRVAGGLLIDPDWKVQPSANGWQLVQGGDRVLVRIETDPGTRLQLFSESRPYHPEIAVEREATRIGWRWDGQPPLEVRTLLSAN